MKFADFNVANSAILKFSRYRLGCCSFSAKRRFRFLFLDNAIGLTGRRSLLTQTPRVEGSRARLLRSHRNASYG